MKIVLIHGLAGSARSFESLERALVSSGHACHSFDLIGFGTRMESGDDYSLEAFVEFIDQEIRSRFGEERVCVLGHSLGGVLALAWAGAHRKRCVGIILLNTHMATSSEELIDEANSRRLSWGSLMLNHPRFSRMACRLLCSLGLMRLLRPWKPRHITEPMFHDYTKHTWRSVSETFRHVYLSHPGIPLLKELRGMPVLNVYGTRAGGLERRIELEDVESVGVESGHYAFLEQPDIVVNEINAFLRRTMSVVVVPT